MQLSYLYKNGNLYYIENIKDKNKTEKKVAIKKKAKENFEKTCYLAIKPL